MDPSGYSLGSPPRVSPRGYSLGHHLGHHLGPNLGHHLGHDLACARNGRRSNTLVIFTGDNGGGDPQCEFGGVNAPYLGVWQAQRGGGGTTGKTSTWEGGHRVPGERGPRCT